MEKHWPEHSNNSDYSDKCEDPPTTMSAQAPSTEPSQGYILNNPDDVQSCHDLHKELYHSALTKHKYQRLTQANNDT